MLCIASFLWIQGNSSFLSPFFQSKLEEERLAAPWGNQEGQINGFGTAWKWGQCCRMVLGASGVPWHPPDYDLGIGLEKPNSSRFCAGLSLNGCWIVFSLLDHVFLGDIQEPFSGFGRSFLFGGSSLSFQKRSPLSGDEAHCPPPFLALWRLLCHMVVLLCPGFGGPLGFLGREAVSCAKLPHVLSLSSAPTPPRVAGITLQLPDLPANVCMCVSPSSPQLPDPPSLCCSLGEDWGPTCGQRCLWLHQGCL